MYAKTKKPQNMQKYTVYIQFHYFLKLVSSVLLAINLIADQKQVNSTRPLYL